MRDTKTRYKALYKDGFILKIKNRWKSYLFFDILYMYCQFIGLIWGE